MTPSTPASVDFPLTRRNPSRSNDTDLVPPGMPAAAERQVTDWVNDAFAIVSRRGPPLRPAELNLRRGLEAIVRHLASTAPATANDAPGDPLDDEFSPGDLQLVLQTLDACLTILARHDRNLNTAQRRIQILVRACRRNADEAAQTAAPAPTPPRR